MIAAVALEFRTLPDGGFALCASGPDGQAITEWRHPHATRNDPAQVLEFYTAIAGTGLLAGVPAETIAAELTSFLGHPTS